MEGEVTNLTYMYLEEELLCSGLNQVKICDDAGVVW